MLELRWQENASGAACADGYPVQIARAPGGGKVVVRADGFPAATLDSHAEALAEAQARASHWAGLYDCLPCHEADKYCPGALIGRQLG